MENENKKPIYYCNVIQIEASNYDFNFNIGIKKNRNKPMCDEDIDFKIIMSPQHAKILLKSLSEVINNYEKMLGNINLGPAQEKK
jgi:hypothetical protein